MHMTQGICAGAQVLGGKVARFSTGEVGQSRGGDSENTGHTQLLWSWESTSPATSGRQGK